MSENAENPNVARGLFRVYEVYYAVFSKTWENEGRNPHRFEEDSIHATCSVVGIPVRTLTKKK